MSERWVKRSLGEIADIIMGQSPPSSTYNQKREGLPFFQGKAEFREVYPTAVKYCSKPLRIAQPNDILMSVRAPVGPVNLSPSKCCIGRGLSAIRGRENKIDQMYLFFYLRSVESKLSKQGQGSTFGAISRGDLKEIEIPHPSDLDAQRRIASIIQRTLGLKQKREQVNELTSKIVQSVFHKMFGGNRFPKEQIGAHVTKTEARDPRKIPHEYFKYVDIAGIDNKAGRIVEVKEIRGSEAPSRARRVIRKDDVIVSTVRPNLNATALVPAELDNQICSTGFCVLRAKPSINPGYLYALTRRREFIDALATRMKGASYPAVTNDDVLDVKIPLPAIELQNKFSAILERIQMTSRRQVESTQEINELFHSLMHKAFKGELMA